MNSIPINRKEWAYQKPGGRQALPSFYLEKPAQKYSTVDVLLPGLESRFNHRVKDRAGRQGYQDFPSVPYS